MHFGVHLTIDAYNAKEELLADNSILESFLKTLPENLGMHPLITPVCVEVGPNNKKDPGGLSGFVMIAESHISVHTFPEKKFYSADVYTCQDELDTEAILKYFAAAFGTAEFETNYIIRGKKYGKQ